MASPEVRRLQRILDDPEYGAPLVRLTTAEQRRILDLVEQNRGREARREILRLDEQRRRRVAAGRRAAAYAKKPENQRKRERAELDEDALFWRRYDQLVAS